MDSPLDPSINWSAPMPRPLRDIDPSKFKLVTIRTNLAQLWMIPSRKLNQIIGGVLARYQESEGVKIYGFCVLSNHLHVLLNSTDGMVDRFFENVNREIARRVNKMNGRIAHFWGRRYDMQVILSDADLEEAFLYVTTNAVKHGLVDEARKWPGLSSYEQSIFQSGQRFSFTHYSLRDDQGRLVITEHVLKVSRLPMYDALSSVDYRNKIRRLIKQREQRIQQERFEQGKGFLGACKVKEQPVGSHSRETARSRRPICYTKCSEARRAYRKRRRFFRLHYADASRQFRAGNLKVVFPEWCYRPPLHKALIERPRKVLDDKYALAASQYGYR